MLIPQLQVRHHKSDVDGWRLTITAYHQLGRCRDIDDWMWTAFTRYPLGSRLRRRACIATHPPGVVRQAWEDKVDFPLFTFLLDRYDYLTK